MGTANRAVIPTIHTMPQLIGLAIAAAVSGFVDAAPNSLAALSRPSGVKNALVLPSSSKPESSKSSKKDDDEDEKKKDSKDLRTAALFIPDSYNSGNSYEPTYGRSKSYRPRSSYQPRQRYNNGWNNGWTQGCYANEQMGYVSGSETTCDHVRSGYHPQNNFFNLFNRQYKCTCATGFVRDFGSCVPKQSCCGANEAYKMGIKSQETTCATPGQYNYGTGFGGQYGCFCADGFVRSPTGECVSVVSCGGTILCKQNEVLRVDFLPEPTCSMQYQPKSEQSHECYCLGDYIRQYRDGPCIHKSSCPRYNNQYGSQWQPQAYVPRTVPVNNQYLQPQAYTPNNLWSGGYGR